MMRKVIILGVLVWPTLAFGHHSNSEYDFNVVTEIEGKVVDVFWRNPHVVIKVEADESGEKVIWNLEGASLSAQRRRGVSEDMIQTGARVRAAGAASKRRKAHMIVSNVLLPNGQELMLGHGGKPRWPDAKLIAHKKGVDPVAAAQAEAMGIFRVWTWGRLSPGWWFFGPNDKYSLTDSAKAKAAKWDEYTDNPQLKCIAPGMPATMGNPYPIEFKQVGPNIELRQEEFDVVRTIHMNGNRVSNAAFSALGYSVGRWEDESTLTIETSKINWPYFNRVGVSQSKSVTVWEKYSVDDKAGTLSWTIRITDPETLEEPYQYMGMWKWVPGEQVARYDCSVADG